MEILFATKLFATNVILFLSTILFDKYALNDAMEKGYPAVVMALWSFITVVSVPLYIIFLLWAWL